MGQGAFQYPVPALGAAETANVSGCPLENLGDVVNSIRTWVDLGRSSELKLAEQTDDDGTSDH